MISYNTHAIENVEILTDLQEELFSEATQGITANEALLHKPLLKKLLFGFVHTSAKITGSGYSLYDTEKLLETNRPSGDHALIDALIVRNTNDAVRFCVKERPKISAETIKQIHQILVNGLLLQDIPCYIFGGKIREQGAFVTGSDYQPTNDLWLLESEFKRVFSIYATIKHPLAKAIYIHDNLSYLRYFSVCNRTAARLAAFLALLEENAFILSFAPMYSDTIRKQYHAAALSYYDKKQSQRDERSVCRTDTVCISHCQELLSRC